MAQPVPNDRQATTLLSPLTCTMGTIAPTMWLSSVGLYPQCLAHRRCSVNSVGIDRWVERRATGLSPQLGSALDAKVPPVGMPVTVCSFTTCVWVWVVFIGAQGICTSPGVGGGATRPLPCVCCHIDVLRGRSMGIPVIAALPSPFTWVWLASWRWQASSPMV